MNPSLRFALILASLFLIASFFVACDDDDSGPSEVDDDVVRGDTLDDTAVEEDAGIDTGIDTGTDVEEEVATSTCDLSGFQVADEYAVATGFGLQYVATSELEAPLDALLVEVWDNYGGPTEPGTYDLTGINYKDCGLCLLARTQCTGGECAKTFYAETGSVTITAIGDQGDQFAATLNGVVFDEVTINSDAVSTPIPGGETWCVDGFAFDQSIASEEEMMCSDDDIACVGEIVNDFSLQNCVTEEMVAMSDIAEGNKALWLVAVAGWCTACQSWVPQVQTAYDNNKDNGLAVAFIMGENGSYGQPTASYCRDWAERHDADPALFYLDHNGSEGYSTLSANIWIYLDSDGYWLLPWNTILDAQTFEMSYADQAGGNLETTLNELLAE